MKFIYWQKSTAFFACFAFLMPDFSFGQKKPNVLVIFGDDIGQSNISAYRVSMPVKSSALSWQLRQAGKKEAKEQINSYLQQAYENSNLSAQVDNGFKKEMTLFREKIQKIVLQQHNEKYRRTRSRLS